MSERLSIRAYAKHRRELGLPGRSHTGVRKAIATGRIARAVRKTTSGRYEIDAEEADAEWAENTDAQAQREAPGGGRPPADDGTGELFAGCTEAASSPASSATAKERQASAQSHAQILSQANAMLRSYQARTAELELRCRLGELVEADGVRRAVELQVRRVRDAILDTPDRLAAELVAEQDERVIRERIYTELEAALTGLADL